MGVCVFYWLLSTVHSIRAQQLNHNTTPVLPMKQRRFVLSVKPLERRRQILGVADTPLVFSAFCCHLLLLMQTNSSTTASTSRLADATTQTVNHSDKTFAV